MFCPFFLWRGSFPWVDTLWVYWKQSKFGEFACKCNQAVLQIIEELEGRRIRVRTRRFGALGRNERVTIVEVRRLQRLFTCSCRGRVLVSVQTHASILWQNGTFRFWPFFCTSSTSSLHVFMHVTLLVSTYVSWFDPLFGFTFLPMRALCLNGEAHTGSAPSRIHSIAWISWPCLGPIDEA